jgi:hypothetical protein
MPHATLDLDALKTNINYHKAHIIITSFIGGKIVDGNWLVSKLSILNSYITKDNLKKIMFKIDVGK